MYLADEITNVREHEPSSKCRHIRISEKFKLERDHWNDDRINDKVRENAYDQPSSVKPVDTY